SSARRVPRGGPESGEFPAPDVAFFTISVDFCHILSGDDPFDPDSRFRARGRRSAAGSLLDRGAARGRSPGRPLVPGAPLAGPGPLPLFDGGAAGILRADAPPADPPGGLLDPD